MISLERCIKLLLLLCLWPNASDAAMPSKVRVDLFQAYQPLHQIRLAGSLQIVQPVQQTLGSGGYRMRVSQSQLVLSSNPTAPQKPERTLIKARHLVLTASHSDFISIQPPGLEERRYPGRLELSVDQHNNLRIVNELPARSYVTLVVGSETPPSWPTEALKAQAVLTQTRLARYHRDEPLNDTTQGEVYLGNTHRRPEVSQAVNSVWGQILTRDNHPLTAFYHASCAGHTSDTQVFGKHQRLPGIVSVPCVACKFSVFAKPTISLISKNDFYHAFPLGLPKTLSVDAAGRPLTVRFANGKTESGYDFWLAIGQKFGWDKAPGLRFSWAQQPNGQIKMTSSGAGHGVGLCQQGAAEMARQGKTYRQILNYYFPQAQLSR